MLNNHPRPITEMGDIQGKRIVMRGDFNVPITDGVVQNDFRIKRALPTIENLLARGARVVLLTHVGRDPEESVAPIVPVLQKYVPVTFHKGLIGDDVKAAVAALKDGEVLLLENLRSYREEEANEQTFAETLSSYGDMYVNDAFSVSHRAHASVVGIPHYLPAFAGLTFMEEYEALSRAFVPEAPSLFILGGAKFETKAPLIEEYSTTYTHACIGGALANDFLKGKGFEVGESLLSPVDLSSSPLLQKDSLIIPVDVYAVKGSTVREVDVTDVAKDEKILDIGPKTVALLAPHIKAAKTILWNGPVGYYEGGYDASTKAIAALVAESSAFSIVGGGDTVAVIEGMGLSDKFGFVSTAGGAMLEFLEKHTLPGIDALTRAS